MSIDFYCSGNGRTYKVNTSYVYCNVCGHRPGSELIEEPNYAPFKWWDCDDGWKIGTLCRWCADEVLPIVPKTTDYAYRDRYGYPDDSGTDEDPILVLENE